MVKRIFKLGIIFMCMQTFAVAQTDSGSVNPGNIEATPRKAKPVSYSFEHSANYTDSLKAIGDSISMLWIKAPDPNRPNRFLDSLINLYTVDKFNFEAWAKKFPQKQQVNNLGKPRLKGDRWVFGIIIGLFLFFAILKYTFSKELSTIVQSFYSNRILAQINKEDMLFNSWPFLFLYLLFGLTIGMFLYLSGEFYRLTYSFTGFEWYLILSAIIIGSLTLKILILKILGYLFGVKKVVREYITILYLSYFNAALIFLPLNFAFSLTPNRFAEVYSYLAFFIIGLIFLSQFFRAAANILSTYRFSKTYLIIYLCALEVCPLLIIIKALRF